MRPIIGITSKKNSRLDNYTRAIQEYGGEPRIFTACDKSISNHLASIHEYLANIDGLLLPGGGDIDPCLYSETCHDTVSDVSKSLDALEIQMFRKALEADLPVFGICRGIQVMSVAMGGSLYQDIPSQCPQALRHPKKEDGKDAQHTIEIESDSLLNQVIGKCITKVNSAHHQAVKEVGKGFVVIARASDRVIEAIEAPLKRFVLGVQYHPEQMLKDPKLCQHALKLFKEFIKAAQ